MVDIQNKVDNKNLVNKVREYEIAISIVDLPCGLNSLNIPPILIIDEKRILAYKGGQIPLIF